MQRGSTSSERTIRAVRLFKVRMAAAFLVLVATATACAPAFALRTPTIIESRTAGAQSPSFVYVVGPPADLAYSTAKSTASPLATWTGGALTVGSGCYYAGQSTPPRPGTWSFTPAANKGGYYNVYATWGTNASAAGVPPPMWTVQSAGADVNVALAQTSGGNAWNIVATGLKYDGGVTKTVRLTTVNPDNTIGKRTYYDSIAFEPCVPTAPAPAFPGDGATVPSSGFGNELNWTAGNYNDKFDVYISSVQADVVGKAPSALVASDITVLTFDPDGGGIVADTTYYWKVVAKNIDQTTDGPVWSFTTSGFTASAVPATWTNQNSVTLTFDATAAMDPVDHYELSLDGGAYTTQTSPCILDMTGIADGIHTVTVKAVGDLGEELFRDIKIYPDRIAPADFTPTASPVSWTNGSTASITFSATDATSGINKYEVALDGGAYSTHTSPYALSLSGAPDGARRVHVKAIDNAGNEKIGDVQIYVDRTPPLAFTPVINPASWTNAASVQVSWATTDADSTLDYCVIGLDANGPTISPSPYNVNTSGLTDGTHTVYIIAVDKASNQRQVDTSIYIDKNPPELDSCVSPDYSSAVTIPVDYTVSDAASGVATVALWYKKGAGGLWTDSTLSSTTVTGTFDFAGVAEDDTYYFGFVTQDNAGNVASSNNGSGDTSTVVDKAAPQFTSIAAAPHYAKAGAVVTITFTASKALGEDPSVSVNGNDATLTNASGQDYTFTYTVQGDDAEGAADVYIEGYDLANNFGSVDDLTQLTIDRTAPEDFTPTANPASWTNAGAISIGFNTTDTVSQISHYEIAVDGGAYATQTSAYSLSTAGLPDGTHTIHVKAIDLAGNELIKDVIVYIDKSAPADFTPTADPASWTSVASISISFSTTDPFSDVNHYELALDGGAYASQTSPYTLSTPGLSEGTHTVHVKAVDNVGNELIKDVTIYFDKTAPADFAPVADPASWANAGTIAISFGTTDATSDINHYEVAVDGGAYGTQASPYSLSTTGLVDGTHTVHVKAIDNAANELVRDVTISLDKVAPADFVPTANPEGWTNAASIAISFNTTDVTSGVARYELAVDGGTYAAQTSPYPLSTTGLSDGTHTVHVKAIDGAGNERVKDVTIYPDKTGPLAFTPTSSPIIWLSCPGQSLVQITWATSDATSGIAHYETALDEGAYTTRTSPYTLDALGFSTGLHTLHVRAFDAAGNQTTEDLTAQVIYDNTPPATSLTFTDPNPALGRQFDYVFWKNWMGVTTSAQNTYNINWTASDTQSGLDQICLEYRTSPTSAWNLLTTSTANSGTFAFDVSNRPQSDSYEFRIRALDSAGNQSVVVYDRFGVYDATKLIPTATVLSPPNGATLLVGSTIKLKLQESMPVFKDPRVAGKAYKDTARDWWFGGHTLTATPKLKAYKKNSSGRPTSLRTTLLARVPRSAPQSTQNTNAVQIGQFLSYVIVNTWETTYTLKRGVVSSSDVLQAELTYSDIVSVGNVRQPDKPNLPGQILPTVKQEPMISVLKKYEFTRFWVR